MDGPGEYLPDVTEGITRVEDLPKAKVAQRRREIRLPIRLAPDVAGVLTNALLLCLARDDAGESVAAWMARL